jgi:altronate hydrolase
VAVAITPLVSGTQVRLGELLLTLVADIPAGHKVALCDIATGEKIIKYGYPIGAATKAIPAGAHVHVHNVRTLLSEDATYTYTPSPKITQTVKSATTTPTIAAYRRENDKVGIRNEIWIVPTVGCVNQTAESLAVWANHEFSGKDADGSCIDGVYAWKHPYGCSQMGDDHATTRKILADLVHHPNAAGVLVLGLGCENNTIEEFKREIGEYDQQRVRFLITQQVPDEIYEGRRLLEELAKYARHYRREPVPASELIIGMKCGGSDGFSGITANALVGRVCDTITDLGGSAILTEVPEMFGAEQVLMDRCASRELFDRTVELINGFKNYYISHNQVVYENPSPGNKEGGITTLEDKSLGCVQKGGHAPVCGVLGYGERVTGKGLQLLEGPGNDIVSTTAMTAAGTQLILFTTGRGTPLGAPVPTLKISSNSELAGRKSGWIDFDAGRLFTEDGESILAELMQMIYRLASGEQKTKNEENGYREIAILKNGVTL